MITVHEFFSGTLNTVDAMINGLVTTTYQRCIESNAELITLLFTVYVMQLGYRFLNHDHHFNMSHIMRHLSVMLVVYGLVMNWDVYHLFVYDIFTNEPNRIAGLLTSFINHSGGGISESLDNMYESIVNASMGLLGQTNLGPGGLVFIVYAGLVYLIGTACCVYALLLLIYAKMAMAVVLALGPIFILFILWDSTMGFFSSWLNTLTTLALIPILTSAILMLMLSVIQVTLPGLTAPPQDMQFYGIAPFLGLAFTTRLLLSQVLSISSGLGNGITLAPLPKAKDFLKETLGAMGIGSRTQIGQNKMTAKQKLAGKLRKTGRTERTEKTGKKS